MRPRERPYLAWAFTASLGLHASLIASTYVVKAVARPPVELDLTLSGHLGSPGVPRTVRHSAPAAPIAAPKAWVAAKPNQKVAMPDLKTPTAPEKPETPPPSTGGPSGGLGEVSVVEGGNPGLTQLPQLLNLSDLSSILKRFYPERERVLGRGGTVVIDLHVDAEGQVKSVDVVRSGGADFDSAARRVGLLLRFSPAYMGAQKVPVRLRQAIRFNMAQSF
jgi:TonB family protein